MNWFKEYHHRTKTQMLGAGLLLLLIATLGFIGERSPLWTTHMKSNNYPQGLHLIAYGDHVEGDLAEINTLNQYIGMKNIDPKEIKVMFLCPYAVGIIVLMAAFAFVFPRFRWGFSALGATMPLGILVVIQYYLYTFGHSLDPHSPLRMPPFTPYVIGPTSVFNFSTFAMPGYGFWLLFVASLLIGWGPRLARSIVHGVNPFRRSSLAYLWIPVALLFSFDANAQPLLDLQSQIDRAAPGSTIIVPSGIYRGPITISKPLTLMGEGKGSSSNGSRPEIRGNGQGNVVTIASNDVTFDGFLVRLSGKEVSDEAAGISSVGSNITLRDNEVRDVYFGIHITSGNNIAVLYNDIHPGVDYGGRAGHGVNIWNVEGVTVRGNYIHDARDGVILTYAAKVIVDSNQVTGCRYGLHSMFSKNLAFTRNYVHDNLLGVALMYTDTMLAELNIVTNQKTGATPFGFLLKDLNNLTMRHNLITCNRVGIYADGLSMQIGSSSIIAENTLAGNERGLSAMSNATFTFAGNNVIDNLTDVYNEGEHTAPGVRWSNAEGGNFWSEYHGFDKNGDGTGDLPYREENTTESILNTSNPARAFIYTPAHLVLDAALRMFPLFRSEPVVNDMKPRMQPAVGFPLRGAELGWTVNVLEPRSITTSLISTLLLCMGLWSLWRWRPFQSRQRITPILIRRGPAGPTNGLLR